MNDNDFNQSSPLLLDMDGVDDCSTLLLDFEGVRLEDFQKVYCYIVMYQEDSSLNDQRHKQLYFHSVSSDDKIITTESISKAMMWTEFEASNTTFQYILVSKEFLKTNKINDIRLCQSKFFFDTKGLHKPIIGFATKDYIEYIKDDHSWWRKNEKNSI